MASEQKPFAPFSFRAGSVLSWKFFSSMELTLLCLALMMVLVLFGTLAQVNLGTFQAQQKYFNSFFVMEETDSGYRFPVFPGGLLVGGLWLVNLTAAHVSRFRFSERKWGLWILHGGLILLLLGQGLTQILSRESQMPVEVGAHKNYAEDFRSSELAVINTSPKGYDEVTAAPASLLKKEDRVRAPALPVTLFIKKFFVNSTLGMGGGNILADKGIGTRVSATEVPSVVSEDEINTASAYVEIFEEEKSLGTWLVSMGLGAPQTFEAGGNVYRLEMRTARHYLPFTLHLKEFRHDVYAGTNIPKNFSSLVRLVDRERGEDRDVLIYMNHPLRYRGYTFYQASFGKGDTLSIFQVVRNPVWGAPYLACFLVALGLAVQFLTQLSRFLRRRR